MNCCRCHVKPGLVWHETEFPDETAEGGEPAEVCRALLCFDCYDKALEAVGVKR